MTSASVELVAVAAARIEWEVRVYGTNTKPSLHVAFKVLHSLPLTSGQLSSRESWVTRSAGPAEMQEIQHYDYGCSSLLPGKFRLTLMSAQPKHFKVRKGHRERICGLACRCWIRKTRVCFATSTGGAKRLATDPGPRRLTLASQVL